MILPVFRFLDAKRVRDGGPYLHFQLSALTLGLFPRQRTRAGQAQPVRDARIVCKENKDLWYRIAEAFGSKTKFLTGRLSRPCNEQVEIGMRSDAGEDKPRLRSRYSLVKTG